MRTFFNKTAVFLLSVFLMSAVAPLFSQTVTYRQEQLKLIDPAGDKALLSLFSETCKTGIKKCILLKNIPPEESQLREPRFARENPILNIQNNRVADNSKAAPCLIWKPLWRILKK